MEVRFQGDHTACEAAESLFSILKLFNEKYGVDGIRGMRLDLTLMDSTGQDIELVDADTYEVLSIFEVYKNDDDYLKFTRQGEGELAMEDSHLKLVVDNTNK